LTSRPLSLPTIRLPRLALNYAVLTTGEFVSKLLAAVAFAYLARVLGPELYGHLEFVLAIVIFFTLVVDCGLGSYGAREIAQNEAVAQRLTAHIVALRLGLALVAVAALITLGLLIDKPWAVRQLLLLYGLALLVTPGLVPWLFQGRDQMKWVATGTAVRWSLFAAGVLLLVRQPDQLWIVPLIEAGAIGAAVCLYLSVLLQPGRPLPGRLDLAFAGSILRQSLPIGASELVWAGKIYFATVFLGLLMGGAEVGWFGAAHRLVIALHTFVWLYFFNLLPSLARTSGGPPSSFRRLIDASMQLTVWAAVFLGLAGSAFAGPIIELLYGPRYEEAVAVFRVLIWLIPLALVSGNYRYALIAYGHQRLEFIAAACGAGLTVVLSYLLIPRLGLRGAALAIVLSELLILGLTALFVDRGVARVPIWPRVWRPLLAGGVLLGVLFATSAAGVWVAGLSAVVSYLAAALALQPSLLGDARSLFNRHG
jgi:O-antigen/teichoic acid export membrane protein